ncbi:hypothetical protein Tco_0738408 [Tanacetum coccineum]
MSSNKPLSVEQPNNSGRAQTNHFQSNAPTTPDKLDKPAPDELDKPTPDELDERTLDELDERTPDEQIKPPPDKQVRLPPDEQMKPPPNEILKKLRLGGLGHVGPKKPMVYGLIDSDTSR